MTSTGVPARRIRRDIQAMRALAVLLVLIYHFWPDGPFTGGYIGVDVFFVISGFLITSHLVRSLEGGTLRLRDFWSRRARRLLPVALLVIAVTVAVTPLLAPQTMWADTFTQAIASSLYVQNLVLTVSSVDYLAEGNLATPLQHYWSLSVEEQFYIVWPLILIAALFIGRRLSRPRAAIPVAVTIVIVVSLASSVVLTSSFPGAAYFIPLTRAWEFGAGAVVFLLARRFTLPSAARLPLLLVGTGAVIASALLFDSRTPFPGWLALIPVLGSAAMIAADVNRGFAGRVMAFRPIQFLGTISYSLYLWHWPVAVFLFVALRTARVELPPVVVAAALFAVSIPLAWASKKFVEDIAIAPRSASGRPLSTARIRRRRRPHPLAWIAVATVSVVALSGALIAVDDGVRARLESVKVAAIDSGDACVGATATETPGCESEPLVGPPVLAKDDLPVVYDEGCQAGPREEDLVSCTFGAPAGPKIALVGDSHASSWFPALNRLAQERGWQLVTFLKSSCRWSTFQKTGGPLERASCSAWNSHLGDELSGGDYALVVTSFFSGTTRDSDPQSLSEGFRDAWKVVPPTTRIMAISDTPQISTASGLCLFGSNASPAGGAEQAAAKDNSPEVLRAAAEGNPSVDVVDLDAAFMDGDRVSTVIGGLTVWRDQHHFTASFSQTLAPLLGTVVPDLTP